MKDSTLILSKPWKRNMSRLTIMKTTPAAKKMRSNKMACRVTLQKLITRRLQVAEEVAKMRMTRVEAEKLLKTVSQVGQEIAAVTRWNKSRARKRPVERVELKTAAKAETRTTAEKVETKKAAMETKTEVMNNRGCHNFEIL